MKSPFFCSRKLLRISYYAGGFPLKPEGEEVKSFKSSMLEWFKIPLVLFRTCFLKGMIIGYLFYFKDPQAQVSLKKASDDLDQKSTDVISMFLIYLLGLLDIMLTIGFVKYAKDDLNEYITMVTELNLDEGDLHLDASKEVRRNVILAGCTTILIAAAIGEFYTDFWMTMFCISREEHPIVFAVCFTLSFILINLIFYDPALVANSAGLGLASVLSMTTCFKVWRQRIETSTGPIDDSLTEAVKALEIEMDTGLDLMVMVDKRSKAQGKVTFTNLSGFLSKAILSAYLAVSAVVTQNSSADSVICESVGHLLLTILCIWIVGTYCTVSQMFLDEFIMARQELTKMVENFQQKTDLSKRQMYKYRYLLKRLNPDEHINMADVDYLGNNLFMAIFNGLLTYFVILLQFKVSHI